MDHTALSKVIGYDCHVIVDDGSLVMIDIPFTFADGDEIPAFAEFGPGSVRFFDAGDVFDHFYGIGMPMETDEDTRFLSDIAESHGLIFTDNGEVEIRSSPEQAVASFARYMDTMYACVKWEKERDEALEVLYREERGRVA
jgi:hypothetical protein